MYWTVVLEAAPATALPSDLTPENVLAALEATPSVLGAIGFSGTHDRMIGARFDVEAADAAEAVRVGASAFMNALDINGVPQNTVTVTRVEAEVDSDAILGEEAHTLSIA